VISHIEGSPFIIYTKKNKIPLNSNGVFYRETKKFIPGAKKPFSCESKDLFSVVHKSLFRGPKILSFLVKTGKNGVPSLFAPDLFLTFHIRKNGNSKFFCWGFFSTFV